MPRIIEDLLYRPFFDDAAGIHDIDAIAEIGDETEIVGDEQDRGAVLGADFPQEAHHLRLDGDIERGGRFIGDEKLGLEC